MGFLTDDGARRIRDEDEEGCPPTNPLARLVFPGTMEDLSICTPILMQTNVNAYLNLSQS